MTQERTLNIIYALSFIDFLGVGIVVPLQSTHLRQLNVSHTVIGIISATYSGTQIISGPLIGGWSDIQDRKYVLTRTIIICAIAYGCLGLTNSVFIILLLRILLGVFKHVQSICKAVITDLVPSEKQTSAFGKTAALGALGFTVGPFIGGHLSEFQHGFSYACCIAMILFIFNKVLVSFLPDIPNNNKNRRNVVNNLSYLGVVRRTKDEFLKAYKQILEINWSKHANGFLLRLLFGLTANCFFSNQTLFLMEVHNLSQKHVGYILSFYGTIGMASAYFVHIIRNSYKGDTGCYRITMHYFSITAICIFGFCIVPNVYLFLILLVPFSVSTTVLRIVTMEILLKKSGETHTGSLSGASNSVMSVARFVILIVTGVLSDIFSEKSVMLLALLPSLVGVYLSIRMLRNVYEKNKNQ